MYLTKNIFINIFNLKFLISVSLIEVKVKININVLNIKCYNDCFYPNFITSTLKSLYFIALSPLKKKKSFTHIWVY